MYQLKLYIVGKTPKPAKVVNDLKQLLGALKDRHSLQIIDVSTSASNQVAYANAPSHDRNSRVHEIAPAAVPMRATAAPDDPKSTAPHRQ